MGWCSFGNKKDSLSFKKNAERVLITLTKNDLEFPDLWLKGDFFRKTDKYGKRCALLLEALVYVIQSRLTS